MKHTAASLALALVACTNAPSAASIVIVSDTRTGEQVAASSDREGAFFFLEQRFWNAVGAPDFTDGPDGDYPGFIESRSTTPQGEVFGQAHNAHHSSLSRTAIHVSGTVRAAAFADFEQGVGSATSASSCGVTFTVNLPGRYLFSAEGQLLQDATKFPDASGALAHVTLEENGVPLVSRSINAFGASFVDQSVRVLQPGREYTISVVMYALSDTPPLSNGTRESNALAYTLAELQLESAPCPADLNQDLVVNVIDLTRFLGFFGAEVGAFGPADLTGDGQVNTPDLILLLGQFGVSCD